VHIVQKHQFYIGSHSHSLVVFTIITSL